MSRAEGGVAAGVAHGKFVHVGFAQQDRSRPLQEGPDRREEYKDYAALKEKIDANPELSGMMKDFESKQLDLQTRQMVGEEVTEDAQKNGSGTLCDSDERSVGRRISSGADEILDYDE